MTPAEALDTIRGYAVASRIEYSPHARREMADAHATYADVRAVLVGATRAALQANDRWKVAGPDQDGDERVVVLVIEDGLLVVTVF
jgi:hypothetical protein